MEDHLYQVPRGIDTDGFLQYTQWSCTRMVPTVIWYRDAHGGFTSDRSRAIPESPPQR